MPDIVIASILIFQEKVTIQSAFLIELSKTLPTATMFISMSGLYMTKMIFHRRILIVRQNFV